MSGASVERILLSVGLDQPEERPGQVFAAGGGHEERGEVSQEQDRCNHTPVKGEIIITQLNRYVAQVAQ